MKITVSDVSRINTHETIHYYAEGKEWFRCITINLYDEEGRSLGSITAHSETGKAIQMIAVPADAFSSQTSKE